MLEVRYQGGNATKQRRHHDTQRILEFSVAQWEFLSKLHEVA